MSQAVDRTLPKTLGTFQLWGIAVGLVISGEYFGWSYGWDKAGTLGFLVTSAFVALMYTTFIFSFTELTTAIPNAGGPFEYSRRAFGPTGGFIAGFATLVEFVFAPPAIALGIGAYLEFIAAKLNIALITVSIPLSDSFMSLGSMFGLNFPDVYYLYPKVWLALCCYVVFIVINLIGIEA